MELPDRLDLRDHASPSPRSSDDDASDRRDLVLLIHGTGGADIADEGEAWWQRGSKFHQRLSDGLEPVVDVQPAGHVFHWSGVNSEAERVAAGLELLEQLQALESQGRRYHLIGNSHGGSVIWHALTASARSDEQLTGLKSWITVATPFIHVDPRPFDKWTLLPWLTTLVFGYLSFRFIEPYLHHVAEIWAVTGLSVPLVLPLLWSVILIVGVGLLTKAVRRLWSRRRIALDNQAAERAFSWYGHIWMALWSSEDEVINGLVTSLSGAGEIIPRSRFDFRRVGSALWGVVAAPFKLIYNHALAAAGDEFIWDRLRARLQGNDRSGDWVTGVSPAPVRGCACWPELPESFQSAQKTLANRNGASFIESFRSSFGLIASGRQGVAGLVNHLKTNLSFSDLVHTSFFEVDGVEKILLAYIGPRLRGSRAYARPELAPDVADWLAAGACELPEENTNQTLLRSDGTSSLRMLKAILIASFVGLAGVSVQVLSGTVVREYTPRFQVRALMETTPMRRVSLGPRAEFWVDPRVFNWLSALVRVGELPVALEQASWFRYEVADMAYSTILSALLRLGMEEEARALLAEQSLLLDQTGRIADTLQRDGAVDALELLATNLPPLSKGSAAYRPEHVLQLAVDALADAGRISAAIQLVVNVEDGIETDGSWATVAFHVAAAGDTYRASLLTEQIAERANKLVAYQSILDSGAADEDLVDKVIDDVLFAFGEMPSCPSDTSMVPERDGGEAWVDRLIRLGRVDDAIDLASICSDGSGLIGAVVAPLIQSARLDDLQQLIEDESVAPDKATLQGVAFTEFLRRGNVRQAQALAGPFDWASVTPAAIGGIARLLMSTDDDAGIDALIGELDRRGDTSAEGSDRLQFSIMRFVAATSRDPGQRAAHVDRLLAVAEGFDWSTLDAFDDTPAGEFMDTPMSDSASESMSQALESLAEIGYVDVAEQLADQRRAWPGRADPYREIAVRHLAAADINAADRAIDKGIGLSWAELDFSILADKIQDAATRERIEEELNGVLESGFDSERAWLGFSLMLVASNRSDQATEYVDRLTDDSLRDQLLIALMEHQLSTRQYDKSDSNLVKLSTDGGQTMALELFKALADGHAGSREPEDASSRRNLAISPDLEQAKRFADLISVSRFRARAYAYLAGALRRSGASSAESTRWLSMAGQLVADDAELANADEVRSLIAEQQAEQYRWNSAAAVCRDCNPIAVIMTNARVLDLIWYRETLLSRNDALYGTYSREFEYLSSSE